MIKFKLKFNKIIYATTHKTKYKFIKIICNKFKIRILLTVCFLIRKSISPYQSLRDLIILAHILFKIKTKNIFFIHLTNIILIFLKTRNQRILFIKINNNNNNNNRYNYHKFNKKPSKIIIIIIFLFLLTKIIKHQILIYYLNFVSIYQ